MKTERKHTPCSACDDTAEVEISHYWDANGGEQEVDIENCMIRCPQCSSDVEANLRAQNAALLEALREIATSGERISALVLGRRAAIALAKGETA